MRNETVYLTASGDLRLAANRVCWPAQQALETALVRVVEGMGYTVDRRPAFDADKGHGFLDSQRMGLETFAKIDPDRPLIVACAAWQYSHHVLPGLTTHKGPILTVANWSGQWPGLVGMLNLNGSLTKAGVPYSTLWGEDVADPAFTARLRAWLADGVLAHDTSHVRPAPDLSEVDECAGVDALVTHRVWNALGYDPETTLHDIR